MDRHAFFADPRRRNLAVLAVTALVALLLVLGALWQQSGHSGAAPAEFLPGFAKNKHSATRIHIVSKAGDFDVAFVPEKGWIVPSRGNYPASNDLVQRTLVGLAGLRTLEPKTARPDWLHFVGLESPPRGDGVAITVSDDAGRVLAALVTGKSVDIGDPFGAVGLFVRHTGENQSWLARSVFEPRTALADWLDKVVMDVDPARIQEVDVDPAGSPSFVVQRLLPSDHDFTLTPIPAGKTPSDPTVPGSVAAAITGFGFDDVRRAGELDFANPIVTARVTTKTFDGLKVTVNALKQGDDYWATVSAEALDAKAAKEAADINAKAAGWAYKVPAFKGQLFMTTLDSLLRPVTPAPAAPPQ